MMQSLKKGSQKVLHTTTTTTGSLVEQLSTGLLGALSGVASGAEMVVSKLGNIVNDLGEDVKVVARTVATGVGGVTKNVADSLGTIVKPVPLVGKPTAYLVKGVGSGIYYVVMTVGDVVGAVSTTVGKTAKTTGKVVVFTLASTRGVAKDVVDEANKQVKGALGRVNRLGGVNGRKTSKKSRSRKH